MHDGGKLGKKKNTEKAWFEHAECPTCRRDVAGFLKREYAWKNTE